MKLSTGRIASLVAAGALVIGMGLASPAFADGDAEAGKRQFNKCKTCHTAQAGAKKIGPHLGCLFGRKAGAVEDYSYSQAMIDSGIVWNEESLASYLADPKGTVPGTKMAFAGLRNPAWVADVIAFLKVETADATCEAGE